MVVTKQERAKNARLQREFHITLEEFNKVLTLQGGTCAICKKRLNKKGIPLRLAVDHCHKTGLVRGLLCWPCNKGIAVLQDNAQRMYNAYTYLSEPPFSQAVGERFTAPGEVGTKVRAKLLLKFNAARKGNEEGKQKSRVGRKIQKRI